MKIFSSRALLFVLLLSTFALADEGMWLFNAFPKATVKARWARAASKQNK